MHISSSEIAGQEHSWCSPGCKHHHCSCATSKILPYFCTLQKWLLQSSWVEASNWRNPQVPWEKTYSVGCVALVSKMPIPTERCLSLWYKMEHLININNVPALLLLSRTALRSTADSNWGADIGGNWTEPTQSWRRDPLHFTCCILYFMFSLSGSY